jgi:hypothetical protein
MQQAGDNRIEIRDFPATRRAKLTPEQVGLPVAGCRRVPGLRREEVAVLAGAGTDWYVRLEKGHIIRWGAHDVRLHRGGVKSFNHPLVGLMELTYDSMELVAAPGLVMTAYTAEPATPSADNLALLASWAATDSASPLLAGDHAKPHPHGTDRADQS